MKSEQELGRFEIETTSKENTWSSINISSILKVESTSSYLRWANVIFSKWIRLS